MQVPRRQQLPKNAVLRGESNEYMRDTPKTILTTRNYNLRCVADIPIRMPPTPPRPPLSGRTSQATVGGDSAAQKEGCRTFPGHDRHDHCM